MYGFLTGPVVNMTVNKTDIERVRYRFSRARVIIVGSYNASIVT